MDGIITLEDRDILIRRPCITFFIGKEKGNTIAVFPFIFTILSFTYVYLPG